MKLNSLVSVQYNMVLPTGRGKGQPQGGSSSSNKWSYPQIGVRGASRKAAAAKIYVFCLLNESTSKSQSKGYITILVKCMYIGQHAQ